MTRVMAPVLMRESMVDMMAAEMPTKTTAASRGDMELSTRAVTTPPLGRVSNRTMPAMPVRTTIRYSGM